MSNKKHENPENMRFKLSKQAPIVVLEKNSFQFSVGVVTPFFECNWYLKKNVNNHLLSALGFEKQALLKSLCDYIGKPDLQLKLGSSQKQKLHMQPHRVIVHYRTVTLYTVGDIL